MQKKAFFLMMVFVTLIGMGCGSDKAVVSGQNSSGGATQQSYNSNVSRWGAPDRLSDLTGKVKTVRGNKIAVFKVITANENQSEEERAKTRAEMQALSPEERAKRREELNKVTNETINLIIPVGTTIIKSQGSGNTEAAKLEIGDIKEGDFLKLWLEKQSSGEEPLVEFVQVLQSVN